MTEVTGTPVLSGDEADAQSPENISELMWVGADEFDELGLYPADVRSPLAELLATGPSTSPPRGRNR
jgi:hypothetical protein